MKLRDLFCNPETGNLSHSKVWANVACAAATYKFIVDPVPYEVWFAYLGLVGGYAAARRWIAARIKKEHQMIWREVLKSFSKWISAPLTWFCICALVGFIGGYFLATTKATAQLAIKDVAYSTLVASYQAQHAKDLQAALTKGEMLQQKADQAAIEITRSNQVLIAQNQKLQKDINYVLQADKPKQDATANGCNEFNGIGPLSLQLYNSALGY